MTQKNRDLTILTTKFSLALDDMKEALKPLQAVTSKTIEDVIKSRGDKEGAMSGPRAAYNYLDSSGVLKNMQAAENALKKLTESYNALRAAQTGPDGSLLDKTAAGSLIEMAKEIKEYQMVLEEKRLVLEVAEKYMSKPIYAGAAARVKKEKGKAEAAEYQKAQLSEEEFLKKMGELPPTPGKLQASMPPQQKIKPAENPSAMLHGAEAHAQQRAEKRKFEEGFSKNEKEWYAYFKGLQGILETNGREAAIAQLARDIKSSQFIGFFNEKFLEYCNLKKENLDPLFNDLRELYKTGGQKGVIDELSKRYPVESLRNVVIEKFNQYLQQQTQLQQTQSQQTNNRPVLGKKN